MGTANSSRTILGAPPTSTRATPRDLAARIEGRLAEAVEELEALKGEVVALAALASPQEGEERVAPRLFTVAQAAQALGVGRSTIHHLIRTGELRSRKLGGSRRIPVEDLDAFIAGLPAQGIGA